MSIVYRTPPTIPLLSGATRKFTTLQEGRLVLTNMKLNCPCIGRCTSQRFVLECGTAQRQDSWSFAQVPTHCTHLSLTGTYQAVFLGRNNWKFLIGPQVSLQTNCNKEGFNVVGTSSNSKERIGIIANNENGCLSCDSRIGYGTGGTADDSNTCGNEATYFFLIMAINTSKPWGISWFNDLLLT